jgi:hypothetical protein
VDIASIAKTLNQLIESLGTDDPAVTVGAIRGLARLGPWGGYAVPSLIPLLRDRDDGVRVQCIIALIAIGPASRQAGPVLFELLKHPDKAMRRAAAHAFRAIFGMDYIDIYSSIGYDDYETFIRSKQGQGGLVPSLDDKFKEVVALSPEDYDGRAAALSEINHACRQRMAAELAEALNARIREKPHETLEEKKELARWVNDQLKPLGLAVRCPNTKLPARLMGIAGSYRPDEPGGTFCFEIYKDGKQRKTAYSDTLPELTLTDAAPPKEPEVSWQQTVGPTASRRGRGRT